MGSNLSAKINNCVFNCRCKSKDEPPDTLNNCVFNCRCKSKDEPPDTLDDIDLKLMGTNSSAKTNNCVFNCRCKSKDEPPDTLDDIELKLMGTNSSAKTNNCVINCRHNSTDEPPDTLDDIDLKLMGTNSSAKTDDIDLNLMGANSSAKTATMASSTPRRGRSSTDEPPDALSDVIRHEEKFIALYETDYPELQEIIQGLRHLMNTFEKEFKEYTEGARNGGIVGIVGGVTTIAGLALAPFTLGTSAVVAGVGSAVALGGGVRSGFLNFMKMRDQKKFIQNIKNGLGEFQKKITPITDILKFISTHINEILTHLNKPEDDISGAFKCAAGASEILRLLRIDDIGEVAAQVSKTVRLTTTLTGVFAGISLVLDILSVIEDNKTLDDMGKLAGNHQISESEMKSKAGKFIAEMRKVIKQLQDLMDELKKTKDTIARTLDLI